MSRQQRGNELGPGAAGTGSRDAHDRCTLSFVPINKPYPDLQHPDLQHPDTARDSDESHETNINTQQAVPKKRGRKPLPKRPLPCAVSLGPVRDYEDEGDTSVQNSGPGFQAAISKQRKAMPAKRTVNMEPTLEHAMQSQDNKLNALCEGQQGPKMPVPSDSTKRKRRETSTLSVEGEKQTKLFENPAIVKVAASSSAKAKTVDTVTTTNISYRGWNATQDTLKSSPNTLTPTTLQKLAAFRHKTPGTQRNSQSPSHGTAQSIHSPELRLVSSRSRTLPTSSDHREFSLSARFFDDASRVTDRTADQSGLPYDQGLPYAKVDESETMHNDLKASDRSKVPYKQQRLDHGTRQGRPNSIKITDSKSTPLDEFEEPTSSECAKLNNLVGTQCSRVDDNAGQHETDTLMGFQQCHPESNTVPTGSYEMPSKIIGSNQRLGEISYDHPALFGDTEVRIQVPQLCPGTSQSIPHQKLDKDNFSDGLDDDDFLALASTPIVAVPLNNDPVMNEAGNLDKTHDGHHLTSMSSSNSPSSSIEDEFPDSDLEEVMLHLPDAQHHGTKETFAPPSELKFATENDSVNQEVYDSNLKFSPPGSSGSIESTQQGTQGDAEATDCTAPQHRFSAISPQYQDSDGPITR
ncbi:hypothetical protein PVAG01_05892 [Phlyctema vagabunda]|uniref:Uncharacterized protein n=1 Tax=Phlyctema vagabunda TaxID=108571 RepID=A0ABR4PEI4_9HELO